MKVHSAIARALRESGVDTIFGLVGDANITFIPDFVRDEGGRFVAVVDERGAVGMADGFARVSGRIGVASISHGPAVTNALTSLVEAVRSRTALVILTSDTIPRRHHPQQFDLNGMCDVAGATYHRLEWPEHITDDIPRYIAQAVAARRPVVLDVSAAMLELELTYATSKFAVPAKQSQAPSDDALDAALGLIASSRRPLVVAGRGAALAGAHEAITALADLINAPLATTALAKEMFDGHPRNLGIMGTFGSQVCSELFTEADCVISFGASLNDYSTVEGGLLAGAALVQCDIDASSIGRFVPAEVSVLGDARETATLMTARLLEADLAFHHFGDNVLDRIQGVGSRNFEHADLSTDDTLDVRVAMDRLDALLPANRIVVTDVGRFMVAAWRHLKVSDPLNFLHTASFASIGLGNSLAIGAAVAAPDQLVVGVVGDGGGMMGILEFSTAVRHHVPLALVVANDSSYGAEYTKYVGMGIDPIWSMTQWPEFADVAVALGGRGVTVRTVAELDAAIESIADSPVPILIDIKIGASIDPKILSAGP